MIRFGAILVVLWVAGCSSQPGRVGVTGTVTVDGTPTAGVVVGFWPADPNAELTAANFGRVVTDANGAFAVPGDATVGFAPGEYRLSFSRVLDRAGKPDPDAKPGEDGARETLPAAYLDPATSGVTASVRPPSAELALSLKTAGLPPAPAPTPSDKK